MSLETRRRRRRRGFDSPTVVAAAVATAAAARHRGCSPHTRLTNRLPLQVPRAAGDSASSSSGVSPGEPSAGKYSTRLEHMDTLQVLPLVPPGVGSLYFAHLWFGAPVVWPWLDLVLQLF